MRAIKKKYRSIFGDVYKELEIAIGPCNTLLDLGCGSNSPIQFLHKKIYSVGVDAFEPSIEKSKQKGIHDEYHVMNINHADEFFTARSFECVLATEVIEHLTRPEGRRLLDVMERLSSNRVVLTTPNGFLSQGEYDGNPGQVHKSGWTADEMVQRGYTVIGLKGWKKLRGEFGIPRFRPRRLWLVISDITQKLICRNHPRHAAAILCIKTINSRNAAFLE
jgi:hypothetical protein